MNPSPALFLNNIIRNHGFFLDYGLLREGQGTHTEQTIDGTIQVYLANRMNYTELFEYCALV